MTCREFADFIMDYLTGDLPDETRTPFERHIERCRNCREYIKQYGDTITAGRVAFAHLDEDVPAEVPEDLVTAILAARKR